MKKILMILVAAAFVFAFSGCSVLETDTESLMHPPLLNEEQEKLNAALSQVAGENYILKYPKNGEMNSAFIFRDLDNDGTDEAMAFYSATDESTRINVLKKESENWVSIYEAAGFSGEIERVEFASVDEKGEALIVRWENETGVYRFNKNRLETIYSSSCDGEKIVDINGDGFVEVLFFKGNAMGRSFLEILYNSGKELKITEQISVHAQCGSIYSAKTGRLESGNTAFFMDSMVYDGVYLTEIIALENGAAERYTIADYVKDEKDEKDESEDESGVIIIVGSGLGKRGIFLRNTAVSCFDTNGDGIMELPVEVREDYASEKSDKVYYIQYMQTAGEETVPIWNGVANTESGYMFAVPESWNEKIGVSIDSVGGDMLFVSKENGEEIFKIISVDKNDYQDKYEDYVLAAESPTKYFYAKSFVSPEDILYIDPETYSERFIFI